ncbi:hypothetical protein D3C79_891480 [compost metagenome]
MTRFIEQVADVVTVARRQTTVQPAGRRQAQARTGTAERHALVGDHAKIALARDLITQRGGIYRCVGLQILVLLANHLQQVFEADELLQEGIAVAGQVTHAH